MLSFLTPIFTAYACSLFLHQPFDKRQLFAGMISFVGVVIIARPDKLWFGSPDKDSQLEMNGVSSVTPFQRLSAVILVLISNLGATAAFTSIRVIGPRAHPLLSVNYYGFFATLLSAICLFTPIFPDITFRLPQGGREWGLLLWLGISGFSL
jgi:drug/metabolite transporter (DMT)-like permease